MGTQYTKIFSMTTWWPSISCCGHPTYKNIFSDHLVVKQRLPLAPNISFMKVKENLMKSGIRIDFTCTQYIELPQQMNSCSKNVAYRPTVCKTGVVVPNNMVLIHKWSFLELGWHSWILILIPCPLRWSTSVLVCFTWLMNHLIYLKLRQNLLLLIFFTQTGRGWKKLSF